MWFGMAPRGSKKMRTTFDTHGASATMRRSVRPATERMTLYQIQEAREQNLLRVREAVIPVKKLLIQNILEFTSTKGSKVGEALRDHVFMDETYEQTPADLKDRTKQSRTRYLEQQARYAKRIRAISNLTFEELEADEVARLEKVRDATQQYISMVEHADRDTEVAFSKSHPITPHDAFRVKPFLRTVYDVELERRAGRRDELRGCETDEKRLSKHSSGMWKRSFDGVAECPKCLTSEHVASSATDASVCHACGLILEGGGKIDETITGVPFDERYPIRARTSTGYAATKNFMKNLTKLECDMTGEGGSDGCVDIGEVDEDVCRQVAAKVPLFCSDKTVLNVEMIRGILQKLKMPTQYQNVVHIYRRIVLMGLGSAPSECLRPYTDEERSRLLQMHREYWMAFQAIHPSVRRRENTLTNNYLTAYFNRELGLGDRNSFIHMLKCPRKIAEHNRIMRICVEMIREGSDEISRRWMEFMPILVN